MTILLTGASGFVGKYAQELIPGCVPLCANGEVVDLRDSWQLISAVTAIKPAAVIHLAAQSFVPHSFRHPAETYEINFWGTFNLLRALKESGFAGRFLYVGSGEVYGHVPECRLPVTEDEPLRPLTPYAVSKVAAEAMCYQWSQTESMHIVMTRPFNHIGPGQDERFLIANIARQIVLIKLGMQEPIVHTGQVDITRDFTDVRDVVHAYALLLQRGSNGGVYNVCSAKEHGIRGLVKLMLSTAGVEAEIRPEPDRFRPGVQRRMYGTYARLLRDSGWRPTIPIEQSLKDILDDWERRLK